MTVLSSPGTWLTALRHLHLLDRTAKKRHTGDRVLFDERVQRICIYRVEAGLWSNLDHINQDTFTRTVASAAFETSAISVVPPRRMNIVDGWPWSLEFGCGRQWKVGYVMTIFDWQQSGARNLESLSQRSCFCSKTNSMISRCYPLLSALDHTWCFDWPSALVGLTSSIYVRCSVSVAASPRQTSLGEIAIDGLLLSRPTWQICLPSRFVSFCASLI